MIKVTGVLLVSMFLVGCRLSGEGINITDEVTIQDSITGEEITLKKDGSFKFDHNYKKGDVYSVEVIDHAPGLVCEVRRNQGEFSGKNIDNLKVECELNEEECKLQQDPVCSKVARDEDDVQCEDGLPCESHEYRGFGSACASRLEKGQVAFAGECKGLQEQVTFADQPVYVTEDALGEDTGVNYELVDSEIRGNVAHLRVRYTGGCGDHDFTLEVATPFVNGGPASAESLLHHETDDDCKELITTQIMFDLLPVKEFYSRQFNANTGAVMIQGIGLYRF